ncbi:hypothetical protein AVEN_224362-1 [Araneus ventricosus]|uniref:Uncharacterized protein n=1 Tax=Araneus ventricosus TaxID=182803 RepID=A0A4Y2Q8M1_ARAVE|nr:hypothetical protein AVEN_224362-1 [Araneus ventricosus]
MDSRIEVFALFISDGSAGMSDDGSPDVSGGVEFNTIEETTTPIALPQRKNECNNTYCNDICANGDPLAWSGFCNKSRRRDYCQCDWIYECKEINNATCEKSCKRYNLFSLRRYCEVPEKNVTCACSYGNSLLLTRPPPCDWPCTW